MGEGEEGKERGGRREDEKKGQDYLYTCTMYICLKAKMLQNLAGRNFSDLSNLVTHIYPVLAVS